MSRHALLVIACAFISSLPASQLRAQATCVDTTGDMCLDVIRTARADGVVADIFQTSDGRYAPELTFGRYIRGVNGCIGQTHTPTILAGYACHAPAPGEDISFYADSLDWYWTQVLRTRSDGSLVADGEAGSYFPWRGRLYDLGGEANRVVLFPITDHPPLPCEAFEYTVWLSNNPDATEIAPESAPDPRKWNPARLIRAFTEGWTRNPAATAADVSRDDLATYLRDTSAGNAVADALATVWALPCGLTFRYVAIQAGNDGNPGPECAFHSQDDELDAVAGLNEDDTAICVDADGDGHRAAACGGGDCDDGDADVHPGAFEPCDSERDLDCLPEAACPDGTECDVASGLCVPLCFEGGCATGFVCADNRCVEEGCASLAEPCSEGTRCSEGTCVAPCEGVICPSGQVCAGGACIDPCAGVVCPNNQVCIADDPAALTICGPACTCTELGVPLCSEETTCDEREASPTAGECVDEGCETAVCGETETCRDGSCLDACSGVVCPMGQTCDRGDCQTDLCSRVICPVGRVCRMGECFDACDGVACDDGMLCRGGACVPDPCFGVDCGSGARCTDGTCVPIAGADGGANADSGPSDGGLGELPRDGSCGCSTVGLRTPGPLALLGAFGLLTFVSIRRRR